MLSFSKFVCCVQCSETFKDIEKLFVKLNTSCATP